MKTRHSAVPLRFVAPLLCCALTLHVLAQDSWIDIGPAVRGGMRVKVSGSSYVQMLNLHSAPAPLAAPTGAGPADAYADRAYDDGYVKLDVATLDPDAVGGPGNTWNWAYNDAGQFSSSANTLTYKNQGDPGYTTLRDVSFSGSDEGTGVGLQVQAGWLAMKGDTLRVDLVLGFQAFWGACSRITQSTYLERKSQYTITDTYNVAETVDPVNGFPGPQTAADGYAGQFDVPGPVISNVPGTRTTSRADLSTAENRVDFHLETDFYEFTLGPRVSCQVTRKISVGVTPKIGFAYIDVHGDRTETFTEYPTGGGATLLGEWRDGTGKTSWRFAAGVTANADVDLGNGYYLGLFGGYEWTINTINLDLGPNVASFDGSGFVAGAVVGLRF